MTVGAIVQARMSSQRLPGKVLNRVAGRPMLQYLLERLEHCQGLAATVVATSDDPSDAPLADFCREHGVAVVRGALHDVASRFRQVLQQFPDWTGFVRANGDAPLLDTCLIERGLEWFSAGEHDLVTNVQQRTYPTGQSVEIVRRETFLRAYGQMRSGEDFEHVTWYFYQHAADYHIFNFAAEADYQDVHLSVDTPDDMAVFAAIVARMLRPHWDYHLPEIVALYREVRTN